MVILSFFHFSEYFCLSIIKPKTLNLDSFLLNHSLQYNVTLALGVTEYLIEVYFFPRLKAKYWISLFGLLICVVGEVIRKLAMMTAESNFDHNIQTTKQEGHVLITHGIYALSRHPGYMGWFYWAIGTQVCSKCYSQKIIYSFKYYFI
jgi:PREDICTED: similar to prenylcysteine carboxylmethyltransferase, partial